MNQPNLFGETIATNPGPLSAYDWIVVNSSGGKDSQAMLDEVCQRAAAEGVLSRVIVAHADLGRVEWQGTREIAQAQAECYGVPFVAVWRKQGDLLNQIESRGKFPGPATRFCTGGLYEIVCTALEEATLRPVIVYCARNGGQVWTRPTEEFCDGRFVLCSDLTHTMVSILDS